MNIDLQPSSSQSSKMMIEVCRCFIKPNQRTKHRFLTPVVGSCFAQGWIQERPASALEVQNGCRQSNDCDRSNALGVLGMRLLLHDLPLSSRQALVSLLEETTPVGTWDWNIVENTFLWSPRQLAHFGLRPSADGTIGYATWLDAIHHDDRNTVQAVMADTIATGNRLDVTFRVLRRDDSSTAGADVHWLRARGGMIRDDDGSPLRMVGTSVDVTESERRGALARARQDAELADFFGGPSRFDIYFHTSQDCLVQLKVEPDGRFTYQMINPAGLKMIGMTMAAAHGLTPIDVLGADNGAQMIAALQSVVETGLPFSYEPTFAYGTQFVIYDATYMPVRDEHGRICAVLCRACDITDQRRMRATLQQAQKLDALGELSAGFVHDFNNLLMGLRGCFNRLRRISDSVEIAHAVELGSQALDQGEALTRRLLAFARKQELVVDVVPLNTCVSNAMGLLRSSVRDANFEVDLTDEPCEVLTDAGVIEACLLNLCINARDARPDGCRIVIETRAVTMSRPPHTDLPEGNYITLSVRDNGPGMPPEVLARALDPFFTTKGPGKGTGLGLSMVYGSVRSLGGTMKIQSEEGKGTVVTIYLRCPP